MSLKETILNKALKEVNEILSLAKEEYEALVNKNKESTDLKISKLKDNATKEQAKRITEKQLELENEVKKLILEQKNKQIDRAMERLRHYILSLDGDDFFNYVKRRIDTENAVGNETMRVNEADYNRYLKEFSTHKAGKKVELDLLNSGLGEPYKIYLENTPAPIDDGFLLISKDYDLNFSSAPLLDKIRRNAEKQIHDILYKED